MPRALPTTIRQTATTLMGLTLAGTLAACGAHGTASDDPTPTVEELAIGDTAQVDFYPLSIGASSRTEPVGAGSVTVTAVRRGAINDLSQAGYTLDADQESSTPYYIDVRFENTSSVQVEPRSPGGIDENGDSILALTLLDFGGPGFEPCAGVPHTVRPAATAEGCVVVLVPSGHVLKRIYYVAGATVPKLLWQAS